MKKMIFALMLLSFQTAFGLQFEGDIVRLAGKNFINIKAENKKYLLNGSSPIISMHLTKLNDGDFISVEANKTSNLTVMTVDSINYVGLKDLLGTWTDDESFCYSFNSHTDFKVSSQIGKTCLTDGRDYTYLINPHSRQWVLLVAGQRTSFVGDFEIIAKKFVEINLYDSQTGTVNRHLSLKKISE